MASGGKAPSKDGRIETVHGITCAWYLRGPPRVAEYRKSSLAPVTLASPNRSGWARDGASMDSKKLPSIGEKNTLGARTRPCVSTSVIGRGCSSTPLPQVLHVVIVYVTFFFLIVVVYVMFLLLVVTVFNGVV